MSDAVPQQLKLTRAIAEVMNGNSAGDCLAAMTICLTELLTGCGSDDTAAAMFMTFISDVSHLMENRINDSQCGWQQTRQ